MYNYVCWNRLKRPADWLFDYVQFYITRVRDFVRQKKKIITKGISTFGFGAVLRGTWLIWRREKKTNQNKINCFSFYDLILTCSKPNKNRIDKWRKKKHRNQFANEWSIENENLLCVCDVVMIKCLDIQISFIDVAVSVQWKYKLKIKSGRGTQASPHLNLLFVFTLRELMSRGGGCGAGPHFTHHNHAHTICANLTMCEFASETLRANGTTHFACGYVQVCLEWKHLW